MECNRSIKFGRLLERADALGFDFLATGHHARVRRTIGGAYELWRGEDRAKDQSYVLYMLGQQQFARTLFPVGDLTKASVRAHAARLGLRTAAKPESMDVCFITRGGRSQFLADRSSTPAGVIVDTEGARVGSHEGIESFTIGQRRGLGVAVGERRYVVDVDAKSAVVTIGTRSDLLRDEVVMRDVVFVGDRPGDAPLLAQVRAHGDPLSARLVGSQLRFEDAQARVAPGQVVALYDGDVLLGGGIAT